MHIAVHLGGRKPCAVAVQMLAERAYRDISYQFLSEERPGEARAVARTRVEQFPDSPMAYLELADVCARSGDRYVRSLLDTMDQE